METRINWGKGLVMGMSAFMLFIITLVIIIFMQDTDSYDHSYYEKGLEFNSDYNHGQQVFTDGVKPVIKINETALSIGFKTQVQGRLVCQRPSDEKMDKTLKFQSDPDGTVEIPLNQVAKGRWQLIFEWTNNSKQYRYQEEIFVP